MDRGLRLIKSSVDEDTMGSESSRRFHLEVDRACNMGRYVFVHRTQKVNAETEELKGSFVGVATPIDLEELAVGDPNPGSDLFLTDFVDVIVRSPAMYRDICNLIIADLEKLVDELNRADELTHPEEVTISG